MSAGGSVVGVGVGPGDPGLVPLKAVATVQAADVVVSVAARGRPSRARAIMAEYLPSSCREITVELVMSADREDALKSYARLADQVREELAIGARIAVLCEGDPLLFGTFIHLMQRLEPSTQIEVIPGVASYAAAAATAPAWPMVTTDEALAILPATMGEEALANVLRTVDAAAILKAGKRLATVRRVLQALDLMEGARLAIEVGTERQEVHPLERWPEDRAPYFSLVLTRGGRPRP